MTPIVYKLFGTISYFCYPVAHNIYMKMTKSRKTPKDVNTPVGKRQSRAKYAGQRNSRLFKPPFKYYPGTRIKAKQCAAMDKLGKVRCKAVAPWYPQGCLVCAAHGGKVPRGDDITDKDRRIRSSGKHYTSFRVKGVRKCTENCAVYDKCADKLPDDTFDDCPTETKTVENLRDEFKNLGKDKLDKFVQNYLICVRLENYLSMNKSPKGNLRKIDQLNKAYLDLLKILRPKYG